jgi:hypothetical protein
MQLHPEMGKMLLPVREEFANVVRLDGSGVFR